MFSTIKKSIYTFIHTHVYFLRGSCLFFLITGTGWFSVDKTVFLLDYVPIPLYTRDRSYSLTTPLIVILQDALIFLCGYIRGSKIYLGFIFWYGIGLGYVWGKRIVKTFFAQSGESMHQWIIALSMLLFVGNPFFSARYGTQPGIWLSTLLMGWGVFQLVTNRGKRSRKDSIITGIYWGLAITAMPHASFMVVGLLGTLSLVNYRSVLKLTGIGMVAFLLNANRLLSSGGATISLSNSFDEKNINEFSTYEYTSVGPIVTATLGYGFRGEKYGSAYSPTTVNTRRRLAGSIIFCFAILGFLTFLSNYKNKSLSYRMMSMLFLSLVLGVGTASFLFAPFTHFLYTYIPGYLGFREPQKWIGLYMMFFLPLITVGWGRTLRLSSRFIRIDRYNIALIILVFSRTPGVIGAMRGRYTMINYPSTYAETRERLLYSSELSGTLLHLPRHSYHQCNWTNKVISNTLDRYFLPYSVLVGDNIEIGNLYSNSISQRSKDIEMFIQNKEIGLLTKNNISGILFTKKCADYKSYERIQGLSSLKRVFSNDDFMIYMFK